MTSSAVRLISVVTNTSQSFRFVSIANKDKAHGKGFFALDESGFHMQQILRAAAPLAMLLVDCLHILQVSL